MYNRQLDDRLMDGQTDKHRALRAVHINMWITHSLWFPEWEPYQV